MDQYISHLHGYHIIAERLDELHAFSFHPRTPLPASPWRPSSHQELLTRWKCPKDRFRVSQVNTGHQVCASYPQEVIVPSNISDKDILKVCTHTPTTMCGVTTPTISSSLGGSI